MSFLREFKGKSVTVSVHAHSEMQNATEYLIRGLDEGEMSTLRHIMHGMVPTLRVSTVRSVNSMMCVGDPCVRQVIDPTEVITHLEMIRFVARRVENVGGPDEFSSRMPITLYPGDPEGSVHPLLSARFEISVDARHTAGDGLRVYTSHVRFLPTAEQRRNNVFVEPVHYPSTMRRDVHSAAVGGPYGQFLFHVPHGAIVHVEFDVRPGIGEMHAKWSPIGHFGLRRVDGANTVSVLRDEGDERDSELRRVIKEGCPAGVFDIEDGGRLAVIKGKEVDCTSCGLCRNLTLQHAGPSTSPRITVSLAFEEEAERAGSRSIDFIACIGGEGEISNDDLISAGLRMLHAAHTVRDPSTEHMTMVEVMDRRSAVFEQENAQHGVVGYDKVTPGMCNLANMAYG